MRAFSLVQNEYNKEELIKCGQGELFEGETRLPINEMLMLDRIPHISQEGGKYNRGEIIGELDINPDLWFFGCHFKDDPVMPGCLGLDAMWQMVGFFLVWSGLKGKGRALGVGEVKFTGQVLPTNKKVTYHIHIRRVLNQKLGMAIADGTLTCDGEEIYTASNLRVGLF